MHKSLYSMGSHSEDAEIIGMRSQLTPIFAEYGVSLVLAGHDHTYSTTYYLDGNGDAVDNDLLGTTEIGGDGTLYLTLGTVGTKFYKWTDSDDTDIYYGEELIDEESGTLTDPIFARLYYDGETLYFEAYQYDLDTGDITLLLPDNELALGWRILMTVGIVGALGGIGALLASLKKKRLLKKLP